MRIFGYIRVSSTDQNDLRQKIAMEELKIPPERIFIDKQSGKSFDRPAYRKLMDVLEKDDLLYITSLDRLGRNYEECQNQWRVLTKEKGVDIVVLDMDLLDTRTAKDLSRTLIADIVLQLLAYVAESEYKNIRKRQAEGIAAAKVKGVCFGRPAIKPPENFAFLVKQWERGNMPFSEILVQTGLKERTFYRCLREFRASKGKK